MVSPIFLAKTQKTMFKLPSFVKLPKYKQFEYMPRYYNPVKEEIEARKHHISEDYKAGENIRGAFRKNTRIGSRKTDLSQMLMISAFFSTFVLYLKYGNIALIGLVIFMAIYIWYKRKNN